jgi:hypothetical protein
MAGGIAWLPCLVSLDGSVEEQFLRRLTHCVQRFARPCAIGEVACLGSSLCTWRTCVLPRHHQPQQRRQPRHNCIMRCRRAERRGRSSEQQEHETLHVTPACGPLEPGRVIVSHHAWLIGRATRIGPSSASGCSDRPRTPVGPEARGCRTQRDRMLEPCHHDEMLRFVDDDDGYLEWLIAHPDGWVLNVERNPCSKYLVRHRASCRTISGNPAHGTHWTHDYMKVCGQRKELAQFARSEIGGTAHRCALCS